MSVLISEGKKAFVLDKLIRAGVTHSQEGISIHDLDYEALKYEWVIQSFKEIDTLNDSERWF